MSVPLYYNPMKRDVLHANRGMYSGVWHGKPVSFERCFRGYWFSDAECEALCNGELIEVHGIRSRDSVYSVLGGLVEKHFNGVTMNFDSVMFERTDLIPFNPDYIFQNRQVRYMRDSGQDVVVNTGFVSSTIPGAAGVAGSVLDDFSDQDEAVLSGMIAAMDMPAVKPIQYIVHDNVPVYVPYFQGIPGFDSELNSESDLESQDDSQYQDQESESDALDESDVVGGFEIPFDLDSETESDDMSGDFDGLSDVSEDMVPEDFYDPDYHEELDPLADPAYDEADEMDTEYDMDDLKD